MFKLSETKENKKKIFQSSVLVYNESEKRRHIFIQFFLIKMIIICFLTTEHSEPSERKEEKQQINMKCVEKFSIVKKDTGFCY